MSKKPISGLGNATVPALEYRLLARDDFVARVTVDLFQQSKEDFVPLNTAIATTYNV